MPSTSRAILLLVSAIGVLAQDANRIVRIPGLQDALKDTYQYSASVVSADGTSTTLAMICNDPDTSTVIDPVCDPKAPATVVYGSSGFSVVQTISQTRDADATTSEVLATGTITISCSVAGSLSASCTGGLVTQSGSDRTTMGDSTVYRSPMPTRTITVTAGQKYLSSAGSGSGSGSTSATSTGSGGTTSQTNSAASSGTTTSVAVFASSASQASAGQTSTSAKPTSGAAQLSRPFAGTFGGDKALSAVLFGAAGMVAGFAFML